MLTKHLEYFKLMESLKEGCPICFLVSKAINKFMDDFLYESINDATVRQQIKSARGFCNRHAWQLQKLGDGFGQATVYSDLMNVVLKEFKEINETLSSRILFRRVDFRATKRDMCIFCKQEKDVTERYISVFCEIFDEPEFNFHYKNSFGLCLPHLALTLKKCKNKSFGKELVDIEIRKISSLVAELKEFMRKHDYRFTKEKFGKEGDSWIRAIEKFTGKEGVF